MKDSSERSDEAPEREDNVSTNETAAPMTETTLTGKTWTITCGLEGHVLPRGFTFTLEPDSVNPAKYILKTDTAGHPLKDTEWQLMDVGKGILAFRTESDFNAKYECRVRETEILHPIETGHEYFCSEDVELDHGRKHTFYVHEAYIRETGRLNVAVEVRPGPGPGPYHNGVAHGDD